MQRPAENNDFQAAHARLLIDSFARLTGSPLPALSAGSDSPARQLFLSPMAVVSHDTRPDPVFNYANLAALGAFEMSWDEFTRLPSRRSVEPDASARRQALMRQVTEQGYVSDYSGMRISSSGRRFLISGATIWNLIDDAGVYRGQAAIFKVEGDHPPAA